MSSQLRLETKTARLRLGPKRQECGGWVNTRVTSKGHEYLTKSHNSTHSSWTDIFLHAPTQAQTTNKMMASRILSRFLPSADDGTYGQRYEDDDGPSPDRAERAMRDSDDGLDALLAEAQAEGDSDLELDQYQPSSSRPRGDEDIPTSLLVEPKPDQSTFAPPPSHHTDPREATTTP
jgi:hypothetical protein